MKKIKETLVYKTLIYVRDISDEIYDLLPKHLTMYEALHGKNKKAVNATFNRLKKDGYILESKTKKGSVFSLSPKAKIKLIKDVIKIPEKWDGKWRLVVFDIPETKRNHREYFRLKLKEIGFIKLQNSVWVFPYEVYEYLEMVMKEFRIYGYVEYMVVEKIYNDAKLRIKFGLK